jgi:hypothetical protein
MSEEEHRATELADVEFTPMPEASVYETGSKQPEFTPMPDPVAPAPETKTYNSEASGIREAAADLSEQRQAKAPTVERSYFQLDGEHAGERSPTNQTITLDRAARDLRAVRDAENAPVESARDRLAEKVDAFRAAEAAAERAGPQQLAPQPESAETAPANTLAEKYARLDPELRTAVEQQAMAAEQARAQYAQSAQMLVHASEAALLSNFPELKGATPESLPHILHGINSSNPQRAQQIVQHVQAAQQNIALAQQHHAAEVQRQQAAHQQQFQSYARASDEAFETFAATRPAAEVRAVKDNIVTVLTEDFGLDPNALAQLYNSNPAFRSLEAQKLIYAAVRNSLAERSVRRSFKGLPPVSQRPGMVDTGGADHYGVGEKMRAFRDAPTAKSAAAALMARRRAAANR